MWPQNFLFVPWFNFVHLHRDGCRFSQHTPWGCQSCSGNQHKPIINPDNVGHAICAFSAKYIIVFRRCTEHLCILLLVFCRRLTLTWSGWWLCMIMQGGRRKSCPFNRATVSSSPSTLMLSGAVAGSMAGRASSPGITWKAPQVWWCH